METIDLRPEERSLLGTLLYYPHHVGEVLAQLPEPAFTDDRCRKVRGALAALQAQGDAIEQAVVARFLEESYPIAEPPGWDSILVREFVTQAGSDVHLPGIVRKLREAWIQRQARTIASLIGDKFGSAHPGHGSEVVDAVAWLQAQAAELGAEARPAIGGPTSERARVFARWFEQDDGDGMGYAIGVGDFDRFLRALEPGRLYTLAGRPGAGKSTLAMQIALNVAKAGGVVLFFSCEMSERELYTMAVANLASVDSEYIARRSRAITDAQHERIQDALRELAGLSLDLQEASGLTLGQVHARILKAQHVHGRVDLVVVDYLNLMEAGAESGTPRYLEIGMLSKGLKRLARSTPTAMLALAQLSRGAEGQDPGAHHLKESGAIEEDSDVVAMIWRDPDRYASQQIMRAAIRKNRHGCCAEFDLIHQRPYRRFLAGPKSEVGEQPSNGRARTEAMEFSR